MPNVCAVPRCPESRAHFGFPSDPDQRQRWTQWMRDSFPECRDYVPKKSHRLCLRHFDREDITRVNGEDGRVGRSRLVKSAVPKHPYPVYTVQVNDDGKEEIVVEPSRVEVKGAGVRTLPAKVLLLVIKETEALEIIQRKLRCLLFH